LVDVFHCAFFNKVDHAPTNFSAWR
jgi:hypothetical protein